MEESVNFLSTRYQYLKTMARNTPLEEQVFKFELADPKKVFVLPPSRGQT